MTTKITLKYISFLFLAVFLSCFFHEFAHWAAGEMLGNPMSMRMNSVSTISGEYKHEWNRNIISAAGPLFTVLQAVVFYYIVDKNKNILLYPYLFFPFVYRLFGGVANVFGANDEGRIGLSFGIGLYTISIVVVAFLLYLVIRFSSKNKIGFKFNLITFFLSAIFFFAIVLADQYFKIKIIG